MLLADHAPGGGPRRPRGSRLLAEPARSRRSPTSLDLRLRTDLLVPLSRWVTPRVDAAAVRRAVLRRGVPGGRGRDPGRGRGRWRRRGTGRSTRSSRWRRAASACGCRRRRRSCSWRTRGSIEEIEARLAPGRLGEVVVEELADDIVRIEMPAGGGVAGQPVNAYLVGRAAFVLVDPGDPTGEALDRALEVARARGGRIVAVALTHADPDHAAGAEAIAEQLGVPVLVGPGGGRHLPYETRELGDGEVIDAGDVRAPGRRDARAAAGSRGLRRGGGECRHRGRSRRGSRRAVDLRAAGRGGVAAVRGSSPFRGAGRALAARPRRGRSRRLTGRSPRPKAARWTTEPTGHTIDGTPWEEPRPPHLPDALTGVSPWVIPFVAAGRRPGGRRLAGVGGAGRSRRPGYAVRALMGAAARACASLLGAALFSATRTRIDGCRCWSSASSCSPPGRCWRLGGRVLGRGVPSGRHRAIDEGRTFVVYGIYGAAIAVVIAFGLRLHGPRARRERGDRPDVVSVRGLAIVLTVVAVWRPSRLAGTVLRMPERATLLTPLNVVALVMSVFVTLAWCVSLRGRLRRLAPPASGRGSAGCSSPSRRASRSHFRLADPRVGGSARHLAGGCRRPLDHRPGFRRRCGSCSCWRSWSACRRRRAGGRRRRPGRATAEADGYGRSAGSDAARFRSRLRPSSTCSVGA